MRPRSVTDPRPYLRLAERRLPGIPLRNVHPIDRGWACFVLDVDDRWILRFPRLPGEARYVELESRLLPHLKRRLRVPVPDYQHVVRDSRGRILCVAYPKLHGTPLPRKDLGGPNSRAWASQLAAMFSTLRRFPRRLAVELGVPWSERGDTLGRWGFLYPRVRRLVHPRLPRSVRKRDLEYWESYLGVERSVSRKPAFNHGDVFPEHVLVDGPRITGVLDWESACFEDPVAILSGLPTTHGFRDRVAKEYLGQLDPDSARRLAFYQHASPVYSVMFGLDTRDPGRVRTALARYVRTLPAK